MIEKLIKKQSDYSKGLFIFFIFLVFFASLYAMNLKIDTDFGKLIPQDSEFNTNKAKFQNAFGENDAVIVFLKLDDTTTLNNRVKDMSDSRVTSYIQELNNTLIQSKFVNGISSIDYSENNEHVKIVVSVTNPNKIGGFKEVKADIDKYLNQVGKPVGVSAILTGMPSLLDLVSSLLINDNLRTILITTLFIFLILYWYSKDIYFTLITLSTPIISLIFLAAYMAYFKINVSITLAAVGVLMLGLGADYSIHIAVHYRKSRKKHESHTKALIETMDDLKIPITASFITTLAGFAALIFGVSPSSQDQGIVLSIGIIIIFLVSFIIFPTLLTVFKKKIDIHTNKSFNTIIDKLSNLAIYQAHHAKTVLMIVGAITIVMIYGAAQVQFSTSNSNWIPADNDISNSFREMNYVYGNSNSLILILESQKGDLRNVQTMKDVNLIRSQIEAIPNIDSVSNPYQGINYDQNEVVDKITNGPSRESFNSDFTVTYLVVSSQNLGEDSQGNSEVLKELRDIVNNNPPYNTKVYFYGDAVRFEELGKVLQEDASVTTLISMTLVFFVATAVYVSFTIGFMSLIPIIIGVIWSLGFMGFFSVPFTSLSTSIISLVLGIGIDFSIHLVDSIKKNLKKMNIESSIKETLSSSGAAILLSSITTFCGFLALLFADLLGTQRLGLSLAFSILAVFLVSITIVPAMMSILNKKNMI